ncbi:dTDP-4-dehydrorhamnose reductase [bacterium]|nr:dTDP-4-dehydrorhamnose reductase [bacterium]
MKILVTGANGQLGCEIRRLAPSTGWQFDFVDIEELDITDGEAVLEYVRSLVPDVIVNGAAYTAVDKAEEDRDLAFKVNRDGSANLAVAAKANGARLVHVSTDFVFDGKKDATYFEDDPTCPLGVYGESKRAGEKAVEELSGNGVIIRTSWLYSAFGANFVKTMRRLGMEKDSIKVVNDQVGSPTWAHDLAVAILTIIPKLKNQGVEYYHYANRGEASWYDFAKAIMVESGIDCVVNPIPSSEFPTKAERPAYSYMDTSKIEQEFGLTIPPWRESLIRMLTEL